MEGETDSFDEYDHEFYKNYDDPENEIIKLTNLQAFEPSERHHIANLIVRRNDLKERNERSALKQPAWNELQALNWVLNLLEEISEEEDAENT
jgi:hypothetical protein